MILIHSAQSPTILSRPNNKPLSLEMETLYPTTSLIGSSDGMMIKTKKKKIEWTEEENKKFESALAIYDENTPNRWFKVAELIPGKSVYDVMKQYKELAADVSDIEAGFVPITRYFELLHNNHPNGGVPSSFRKRGRSCDHERKKGVPWTEEEHRRFLMGLEKHGKGDWRNISRNFVISKTPTQVASHAQKYYLRQLSGGKDKRRPSIHDITTVNLTNIDLSHNNNNNRDNSIFTIDQSSRDLLINNNNSSNEGSPLPTPFGSSYHSSFEAYPYGTVNNPTRYQLWG